MAKGSRHRARMAAIQALYQWDLTEQPPEDIESHFIQEHDLERVDQEYFHEIVRQVPRRRHELEDHFVAHLGREIDAVDPVERAILRLASYELEFHPEIPYKVVINEAVELAKVFGAEHSYRFINGVLDKVVHVLRPHEVKS
jgi:N utilization substance protein B